MLHSLGELSVDSRAALAGFSFLFTRRIRWLLKLDLLAGVTRGCRWTRSVLLLDALARCARYSWWIASVSCQWISAPLCEDSLADSLTGFARWIRSLDSLAREAGFPRLSRSQLFLDSFTTGFTRWACSLLMLDYLGEFSVDSRAALPGFSC
jgi:hypothetical protein